MIGYRLNPSDRKEFIFEFDNIDKSTIKIHLVS